MLYKLLTFIIVVQLLLTCNTYQPVIQIPDDIYNYPVRPKKGGWQLKSHQERIEACQIPETILTDISTTGLIYTILDYPLLYDMFFFNTPQSGFDSVASNFNGLQELMKREDAGKELLVRYQYIQPKYIKKDIDFFIFNFLSLEMLLCQNGILDDFTETQLKELILEAKKKYEEKQKLDKYYTWKEIEYSLRLIGKTLQQANFKPFAEKILKDEYLKEFLESGVLLDDTTIDYILSNMKQYLLEW